MNLCCENILSLVREMLADDYCSDAKKVSAALILIDEWSAPETEDRQPPITTTGVRTTWTKPSVGEE